VSAAFPHRFLAQRTDENLRLDAALDRAWDVLLTLPRSQLTMIPPEFLDAHGAT
jgi:V/A-type H+-transporting ATPase subunit B